MPTAHQRSWRDGGRVPLVVRTIVERFRASLFAVPMIWIAAAVAASQIATWIDVRTQDSDVPSFTDTTVDSARAILAAIGSGTITAASVVFSLTLVSIQMSTSVYSSRVLRSFLRDRFQQNMIGVLLATFTFSLLVLREVRGPLDESGTEYVPRLSVFLAVLFAMASVLALLASISHTAQSLRSSAVVRELVDEMARLIDRSFMRRRIDEPDAPDQGASAADVMATDRQRARRPTATHEPGAVLTASDRGWVQQISIEAIRGGVPDDSNVRLDVGVGSYVYEGGSLLTIWPPPPLDALEARAAELRGAFALGGERTLQQDVAFGFMMIEDVAVKALSPGVNDPNTASEVIEQLGELVLELLIRELHEPEMWVDGCLFIRSAVATHDDTVVAAFNQIRHYAMEQPSVQLVLTRTLIRVGDELRRRRLDTAETLDALRSMLELVGVDVAKSPRDPAATTARAAIDACEWARVAPGTAPA